MSRDGDALRRLLDVMARLRDPQKGCPWDLEQDFASIAPYTLEEAYEVADAIASGSPAKIREELGDLLFQVVFHARIAEERQWFDFDAVAAGIADKLVRRHPHVFADAPSVDSAEQSRVWEALKAQERAANPDRSVLADVPKALPALVRAAKLGKRAARVQFDFADAASARAKVVEEWTELNEALALPATSMNAPPRASDARQEELGDLLFAIVNWSRHLGLDAEDALRSANAKFERRFRAMERLADSRGTALDTLSAEGWDILWNEAKSAEEASG